jgi:AraC-like DNA-binding protein
LTAFLPIVRSAALEGFPALAQALGLDAQALLRQAGLHPRSLLDPDTPLAADSVQRLLEASARASGQSDFGLRLAARRGLDSLGPISLLLKEQPSVQEALETLLRYLRLVNPSLVTRIVSRDDRVVVQEDLLGDAGVPAPQSIEMALGVMRNILAALLGPRWRPQSVHLRHAPPAKTDAHEAYFGCRVLFRSGFNGIACRPSDMQARPRGGDPGLARLARSALERALASEQGPASVVRQLMVALLPGGRCTSQLLARHLGVDRRTLHRYLAVQGQTFSSLLLDVRRQLVQTHLTQGHLPLSESAALLGFSSQSAFAYWFRTQFGSSVSAWHRAHPQASPTSTVPMRRGVRASAGVTVRTSGRTSG